jgi:hypothetical protein
LVRVTSLQLCYSVSSTLPSGQLSNVPWRRTGVKYTNNEAYFDVVEEVDAIIDKAGSTVFAEIQGYVRVTLKLLLYSLHVMVHHSILMEMQIRASSFPFPHSNFHLCFCILISCVLFA